MNPNCCGSVRAQELREGQFQAQAGREHGEASGNTRVPDPDRG